MMTPVYTAHIKVRYYETDNMGIVHHSNYIRYFEVAREEAMAYCKVPYEKTEEKGYMTPIISISCEYKHPAKYADVLSIKTYLTRLTGVKMGFYYEVFNQEGVLCATGETMLAYINAETRKPVRCPQFVMDALKPYVSEMTLWQKVKKLI